MAEVKSKPNFCTPFQDPVLALDKWKAAYIKEHPHRATLRGKIWILFLANLSLVRTFLPSHFKI